MTATAECVDALRGFIERADRTELAEAQAAIIQFAMSQPDRGGRADAMSALRTSVAGDAGAGALDPVQQAYRSVVEAMIERTREAFAAGADRGT